MLLALALSTLTVSAEEVRGYSFPDQSAVRSTVLGTPHDLVSSLAAPGDIRERTLYVDTGKTMLESDRFSQQRHTGVDELAVSLAYQRGAAPLVVSIAGTGGDHASGKAALMKRMLWRAGYHVLSISSPTNPDFIFAAGSLNHAGISPQDAEDLYHVIKLALQEIRPRIQITDYYLTGYSLGALNSAFLSKLDDERGEIGFSKVLMINPPVNLLTSVTNLTDIASSDDLYERYGSRKVSAFMDPMLERVADYYRREGKLDLSGDAMYQIAEGVELSDFDLRVLIRIAFTFSTADMVFTTDVMNDYGYVVPPGRPVNMMVANNGEWLRRSFTWRFIDYFHLMILPFWQERNPGITEQEVVEAFSLLGIRDYLARTDKIMVQHNVDDIILGPGDMDWIRDTFGDRALVYPAGGHCGNMDHERNVSDMLSFFEN